jgi:hypothetical protein
MLYPHALRVRRDEAGVGVLRRKSSLCSRNIFLDTSVSNRPQFGAIDSASTSKAIHIIQKHHSAQTHSRSGFQVVQVLRVSCFKYFMLSKRRLEAWGWSLSYRHPTTTFPFQPHEQRAYSYRNGAVQPKACRLS